MGLVWRARMWSWPSVRGLARPAVARLTIQMNMNTPRVRTWRVVLDSGREVTATGRKVVVTSSGALMVLAETGDPHRIFAQWVECEETTRQQPPVRSRT